MIIAGLIGGLIRAIWTLANSAAKNEELNSRIVIGTIIRDVVIGGFSAATGLLFSDAMSTENGQILVALLAGIAGPQVVMTLLESVGLRNERDFLAAGIREEDKLEESGLLDELQKKEDELTRMRTRLAQNEAILEESVKYQQKLERLLDQSTVTNTDDDDSSEEQTIDGKQQ